METVRIAIELDAERGAERGRQSNRAPIPAATIELHLMIKRQPSGLRADLAVRDLWASTYAANALVPAPLPRLREIV